MPVEGLAPAVPLSVPVVKEPMTVCPWGAIVALVCLLAAVVGRGAGGRG